MFILRREILWRLNIVLRVGLWKKSCLEEEKKEEEEEEKEENEEKEEKEKEAKPLILGPWRMFVFEEEEEEEKEKEKPLILDQRGRRVVTLVLSFKLHLI